VKGEFVQELDTLQISVGQGHILHGFKCLGHTMSRLYLPEKLHVVKYGRTVVVSNMDGEEFPPFLVNAVAVKESCCSSLETCLNTCPATEACKGPHLNNVRFTQILGAGKFKLSLTKIQKFMHSCIHAYMHTNSCILSYNSFALVLHLGIRYT
jgi:hypothetical protein